MGNVCSEVALGERVIWWGTKQLVRAEEGKPILFLGVVGKMQMM